MALPRCPDRAATISVTAPKIGIPAREIAVISGWTCGKYRTPIGRNNLALLSAFAITHSAVSLDRNRGREIDLMYEIANGRPAVVYNIRAKPWEQRHFLVFGYEVAADDTVTYDAYDPMVGIRRMTHRELYEKGASWFTYGEIRPLTDRCNPFLSQLHPDGTMRDL